MLFHRQLTVSKDFSLSLGAPSLLIRGEEIVLEVKIINHLEQEMDVCRTHFVVHCSRIRPSLVNNLTSVDRDPSLSLSRELLLTSIISGVAHFLCF